MLALSFLVCILCRQLLLFTHFVVVVAATTVELSGVLLQWDYVQEPYAHNFVQYRLVLNLTATLAYNDTVTPWTTLAVIPQKMSSMLVPDSVLMSGAYYEFRLGFQSGLHTSVSNTLVAKAFDSNSALVNSIEWSSLDTIFSISWGRPEYSTEIIGYAVSIYYK